MSAEQQPTTAEERADHLADVKCPDENCWEHGFLRRLIADIKRRDEEIARLRPIVVYLAEKVLCICRGEGVCMTCLARAALEEHHD